MRKLITIGLLVAFAGIASGASIAEAKAIAAGSTTATFTNASTSQVLYIYNVATVDATATNDTYSVQVAKDLAGTATWYQIGTVSETTNSVYGNSVITNKIKIGPSGTYRVVRGVTNYAASVFVDIRD